MKTTRAASLATTLLLISVVLLAGLTLAGSSIMHMGLSSRVSNARHALNLAESIVAQVTGQVVQSQGGLGLDDTPSARQVFELRLPGLPEGSRGRLTFDKQNPAGIPYSTQTYQDPEGASRLGYGDTQVPWNTFHLVGTGECNGVARSLEVMLHVPPYPYALSSSGPIRSSGPIMVGTLRPGQILPGGIAGADRDRLLPGHLASNSAASDGVLLDRDSLVTGNLFSAGGVVLNPPVEVRGEVRTESTVLPDLDIEEFRLPEGGGTRELPAQLPDPSPPEAEDPEGGGAVTTGPNEIRGFARRQGSLTVDGDLELNRAVVWVDGDVNIQGGILGTGLVAASGGINITGGAALEGLGQAALVAGGDVVLQGTGVSGSAFQGLVYTHGKFTARDISIIGALVVKSQDPTAGVELERAGVGGVPEMTRLKMVVPNAVQRSFGLLSSYVTVKISFKKVDGTVDPQRAIVIPPGFIRQHLGLPPSWQPPELNLHNPAEVAAGRAEIVSWLTILRDHYASLGPPGPAVVMLNTQINALTAPGAPSPFDPEDTTLVANSWRDSNWTGVPATQFGLDLNQFLSFGDRVRVRLWREL